MASDNLLFGKHYNPDVLSCLANLSSDEVFTSPELANQVLDMLPPELWTDKNAKFLDPAVKSGVFLREIAKRLIKGLEDQIPDLQERIDHIFHNQIYGIAITELTSLLSRRSVYCSKYPHSPYSVSKFDGFEGNIRYRITQHNWVNGRCKDCGASKEEYDRGKDSETHAYGFIHGKEWEEYKKMKFDVVISNPPYQMSDGGHGVSATPIYQHFVRQAKKLNPRYISMIIPSRWFSGGRGLDSFRAEMIGDRHIQKLVDYENFKDIFPGVDLAGGACYFLWVRDNEGKCNVTNVVNNESFSEERYLDEFSAFIRSNKAVSIVRKIQKEHKGRYLDKSVSASKPFGLRTFYQPLESGIPCLFIQRIGLKFASPSDVTDSLNLLDKWKLLIPRSPIAGQTDFSQPVKFYYDGNTAIVPPGTCCTESYIVAFASKNKLEVESFRTYLYTKTFRFLLLQNVVSQDVTREKFKFVPDLEVYTGTYTDEYLCGLWGISKTEWAYIDSRITEINGDKDGK